MSLKNIPLSEPPSRFLGRCESHCRETAHLICLAKFSPSFSPSPLSSSPPFSDSSTISLLDLLFPSLRLCFPTRRKRWQVGWQGTKKRVLKKGDERTGRRKGRAGERRKGFDVRGGGGGGGKKRPRGSLLGGGRKVCLKY